MVWKLTSLWWPMCAVVQVVVICDMPAGAALVAAIVQHKLVSIITLATHCHALYPILPLVIHAHSLVILVYSD